MSKIKNGGLDQCDAEPFEQQQFGTAGVEGVKLHHPSAHTHLYRAGVDYMNAFECVV